MYDVILYFCGVHTSHVHKYLTLYKKISKQHSAAMLLDNGKWGVKSNILNLFSGDFDLKNVHSVNPSEAMAFLRNNAHKIGVFSSNYRKGHIGNQDIMTSKSKGATTIQISEMPFDFYYAGADYVSLISENIESSIVKNFKNYGNNAKKIFSNCFLWDNVYPGKHFDLSKNEFYEKYKLDKNKPFYIWAPDSIQCQHPESIDAYKEVCKINNIIVKLHPNEIRRHKAERVNYQWSHNMYPDNKVRVLDSLDTHSAFVHTSALISYQSSIGYELPFYGKPCIYLNVDSDQNLLFNDFSKKFLKDRLEFVGECCKIEDIINFVENKKYDNKYDYNVFLEKYLTDNHRTSCDILTQQISELL